LRKIFQTLGLIENFLDQMTCGSRIIQSNVLSDSIQFLKGGLCPDYFSHLLIFSLAPLWLYVLPSSTARSPRESPSSSSSRRCMNS